ncbi:MAG: electron transfer flavoprotein subunit beta/FixA family protein [Solirubrobacterales bacterium]|nr:electron transfer flavoprotein subunit beta/FixA family protein [Solirubrobacterales bacterium]MBV8942907.1 electron transfer flavoprotein subunit beta/FixA family protein [Solirubrobacterales bacterium]MBV9164658.1 electron transfer flavoprotein subunit beta/FixA family protein [Solirubrobacterales bacterium]MBV9534517.1 electron transfer flavoprotein subunit beta/FixA family protein [Solirubrobacterales bacterium]
MKFVVCVKQVASLDEEFELLEGGGVDSDFVEWELNEWDTFSLEAALALRESGEGEGGEVVAVTVGEQEAEEALLACLARGADRAVRVWDESLQGADPLAVARVLAAVVERESPDLVFCGVQSSDAVTGSTGTALAGYLDMARVAVVTALSYDAPSSTLTVDRELESGLVEVVRIGLPALLTIQTGINEPRYATLRAIKQAREKPLVTYGLEDVGLDAGAVGVAAGAHTIELQTPERGAGAQLLDGSPAEVAARIVEIVQERMSG